MTWDVLRIDVVPRPPPRARALVIAAGIGVLTGLISSLPSPLPDLRLGDSEIVISAERTPLHAGIAFGAGIALILWLWASREPGKCLLALALTLLGWIAAINTAHDVMSFIASSELYGTEEGAKDSRQTLGLLLGLPAAGAVGAGLTAFGAGIAAPAIRRPTAWALIVLVGALFGLMIYPASWFDTVAAMFVPWQAAIAASIAYGLTAKQA
jgi:hypothetical protein